MPHVARFNFLNPRVLLLVIGGAFIGGILGGFFGAIIGILAGMGIALVFGGG